MIPLLPSVTSQRFPGHYSLLFFSLYTHLSRSAPMISQLRLCLAVCIRNPANGGRYKQAAYLSHVTEFGARLSVQSCLCSFCRSALPALVCGSFPYGARWLPHLLAAHLHSRQEEGGRNRAKGKRRMLSLSHFIKANSGVPIALQFQNRIPRPLVTRRVSWEVNDLAVHNADVNKAGSIKNEGEDGYWMGKEQRVPPMTLACIC